MRRYPIDRDVSAMDDAYARSLSEAQATPDRLADERTTLRQENERLRADARLLAAAWQAEEGWRTDFGSMAASSRADEAHEAAREAAGRYQELAGEEK